MLNSLIALLLKEPDAELIASALVSATAIRMAAPNWLEVAMVAMARRGIDGYQQLSRWTKLIAVIPTKGRNLGLCQRPRCLDFASLRST